jgi:sucrose phosphorylase
MSTEERIRTILTELYGEEKATNVWYNLLALLNEYHKKIQPAIRDKKDLFTQKDAFLITYADQVQSASQPPLRSLADFLEKTIKNIIPDVHILPFFPYSSDDGFSVVDYRRVDPRLGNWEDIARLNRHFSVMFDAVINHVSVKSGWFQAFLQDDPRYSRYFIVVEGNPDLSAVVRPRATPLLTRFQTPSGEKAVWTTFSTDQADLNYQNPEVLLEIIDILLFYVMKGAKFIRLDAIAYLWKEIGSTCIHLPQTHLVIRLFRAVLDAVAPQVALISETNVPHSENISYFGDEANEAQMVYNFSLPPLVLHTLYTGDATAITRWAAKLKTPFPNTTFFNFLASHDGIGLNPLGGILTAAEIDLLVETTIQNGGLVSYKSNPDGSRSPYELNINYFDALANPDKENSLEIQINRFLLAHAIMFALGGVPGIYFHSLFGSRGWREGVEKNGYNRAINRQKLSRSELERDLNNPQSLRWKIYHPISDMLLVRAKEPGFHPNGSQRVLEFGAAIFALKRESPDRKDQIICLNNVTGKNQEIRLNVGQWKASRMVDLINGEFITGNSLDIDLKPYQFRWLKTIG